MKQFYNDDDNQFAEIIQSMLTCFVYQVAVSFNMRWSCKNKKINLKNTLYRMGLQDQMYHKLRLERYGILYQMVYMKIIEYNWLYQLVYTSLIKCKF